MDCPGIDCPEIDCPEVEKGEVSQAEQSVAWTMQLKGPSGVKGEACVSVSSQMMSS